MLASAGSPAGATIPPDLTLVPVSPGSVVTAVDAQLLDAGSIEGTLNAVAGGDLNASVVAYSNGEPAAFGFTDVGGHYEIGGLQTGDYEVCVSPQSISGGNSTTRYLGRCYVAAPFNGTTVPATATEVAVTAGSATTGINITIPSGAAISGKIMNGGGSGIGEVNLIAKNRTTGALFPGFTAGNGTYTISGLTPSGSGYALCANPRFSPVGTTGYLPRCFKNVAWNGGAIPSGATTISVSAGHTHTNVDVTLPHGAAVSGHISKLSNGEPIVGGAVGVFSSTGHALGFASTNTHGNYTVKGLAASTSDRVCAFPVSVGPGVTFQGECFKNIAWNGDALPHGTTSVSTTIGHIHAHIDFALTKTVVHLGSIAGTITEAATQHPLQDAQVVLFGSSGQRLGTTSTSGSGSYSFLDLKANTTGYRVCAEADVTTVAFGGGATPPGGWAPLCYSAVAWNGLAVPSGATKIPISAGQNKIGIDLALPAGGGISGTTFQSDGTTPAFAVIVDIFTPSGHVLATATSSALDGTYEIDDLPKSATGYPVCFNGLQAGLGTVGYLPQCWNDVAWDGTS